MGTSAASAASPPRRIVPCAAPAPAAAASGSSTTTASSDGSPPAVNPGARCAAVRLPSALSTLRTLLQGCPSQSSCSAWPTRSWVGPSCCSPSSSPCSSGNLSCPSPLSGHGASLSPGALLKCATCSPSVSPPAPFLQMASTGSGSCLQWIP